MKEDNFNQFDHKILICQNRIFIFHILEAKLDTKLKTAISLFSGAGGMDVGIQEAGFNVLAANELNTDACNTLRINHSSTHIIEGNIEDKLKEISFYQGVDLVFGGPPCQGFSVAGKMDVSDPRSKLIFTFLDVVKLVQPKAFIMENVKSLATLEKFEDIRNKYLDVARSLGYTVSVIVLNAKDYGVPQSRERVFFIGLKEKIKITAEHFVKYQKPTVNVRDAIKHLGIAGSKTNPFITNAKITIAKNPILRKSPYAGMLFNGQGRPVNLDTVCATLPASMGGNRTPIIDENNLVNPHQQNWIETLHQLAVNHADISKLDVPKSLRRLTIDEAKVIQTFPNDYIFSGSSSAIFTQIGNAVPCKLARVVGSVVKDNLGN